MFIIALEVNASLIIYIHSRRGLKLYWNLQEGCSANFKRAGTDPILILGPKSLYVHFSTFYIGKLMPFPSRYN